MYTQGTRKYKKCDVSYLVMDESEMSKHLKDLDRENNELFVSLLWRIQKKRVKCLNV